jgi:hypothetical protein
MGWAETKRVGVASVALMVTALLFANFFGNDADESGDLIGFLLFSLIGGIVAWALFTRVIPTARQRRNEGRTGAIIGTVGVLSAAVFWTGLPYVLGPAAIVLGASGLQREPGEGGQGLATAAIALGALAVLGGLGILIGDEAGG